MTASLTIGQRAQRRRSTPTVLQIEAVECGAAALAMVLAAHGRWESLSVLRRLCGVSRDGSRAVSLLRAARGLGMEAKGFSIAAGDISKVPVPAIIFVNQNHYMVLEGVRGSQVHLNDPAGGRLVLDPAEFQSIYSGIVLCFAPKEDFVRSGRPPALLMPLFEALAGAHDAFFLLFFCGVFLFLPLIALPAFSKMFVDQIIVENQRDWFEWLLAAMALALAVQIAIEWIRNRCVINLHNRVSIRTMSAVVERLLQLPITYFAQRPPGVVGSRANRGEMLAGHVSGDLGAILVESASAMLFLGVMAFYSPILTAIAAAVVGLTAALNILLLRQLQQNERRSAIDEVKLGSKTIQGLAQIESLKASGTENIYFEVWTGLHARLININLEQAASENLLTILPGLLRGLGQAFVLVTGGLLIMQGSATIGIVIAFQQLSGSFDGCTQRLFSAILQVQRARGTLDLIDDVLDTSPGAEFAATRPKSDEIDHASALGRLQKLSGSIEIRDLTFGYAAHEPPLITNFSLSLEPGSRVALVGGSGSGKSTLGRLICGLLEPWSGEVLFDGRPIETVPRDLLRNSMAVVDQDIMIFNASIAENISLWDSSMPSERIVAAAKDAMIHDDIIRRHGTYPGMIGERGRDLSGGQRQRLEIARALVGEPSILILDEATSALDTVVEKAVMDNIRRRGCTCIIIAHRLSTIRDCDEILVMDRGRIIERGRHRDLIKLDGPYKRLIEN